MSRGTPRSRHELDGMNQKKYKVYLDGKLLTRDGIILMLLELQSQLSQLLKKRTFYRQFIESLYAKTKSAHFLFLNCTWVIDSIRTKRFFNICKNICSKQRTWKQCQFRLTTFVRGVWHFGQTKHTMQKIFSSSKADAASTYGCGSNTHSSGVFTEENHWCAECFACQQCKEPLTSYVKQTSHFCVGCSNKSSGLVGWYVSS